ncbi:hypothetical protein B0J12DRAFT_384705 [Macrophomina phaseolina]|uniref:PH domain-containing protein n=1 Tax=Macrophomina phaseolina TaxID=35725 RepID=A0ABQ8FVV0_9PEZI|nr:hypothetical protein B0J12DRAFT_384705 [Macrophomina phaseolina]
MPRPRVLSFMSQWGGGSSPRAGTPARDNAPSSPKTQPTTSIAPSQPSHTLDNFVKSSPTQQQRNRSDSRPSSRPISMVQTYQPPLMEVAQDTLPELQPIFTYLNSHSNKLYQEGYFLKLHDLDARGRPSPDRNWTEVFAQLVGTVLSVWDAQRLDEAGEDGEVVPSFINLADASIKMIESLPMNGQSGQTLHNVLSVSTAANNRYLFHFNSLNSLTQWTAGIRLAMFEHSSLQEAYTGSLIAGKGRFLNNIRSIMERTRFKYEDWARVRFGAGTPWRRCWCVITPPDEKEFSKIQKALKKGTIYNRSQPVVKGDVKFYETRKVTKKTRPIATITDAYSAYAIYPQSKPLIDQSTLVKVEGRITIHSTPESTTEGFVFVMPEVHPAVSGFEIMLRFLFPVFDTFGIYGRPSRLVADPLDTRSLMFAMPKDRRYGYLDILDVASLIHTDGSQNWSERQWRKQMKDLTSKRMTSLPTDPQRSRRNTTSRTSLPPSRTASIRFSDGGSTHSQPGTRTASPARNDDLGFQPPRRADTASPNSALMRHQRSVSERVGNSRLMHSRNASEDYDAPPPPPAHRVALNGLNRDSPGSDASSTYSSGHDQFASEGESPHDLPEVGAVAAAKPPPTPVHSPPDFSHGPGQKPRTQPYGAEELRRAQSGIDEATLQEMAEASNRPIPANVAAAGAAAAWKSNRGSWGPHGRRSDESERNQRLFPDVNRRSIDENRQYWNDQQSNRLPTIPASPYIAQGEPHSATSATFSPIGPPVPEHREVPQDYFPQQDVMGVVASQADSPNHTSPGSESPAGISARHSIQRKPVPGRLSTPPSANQSAVPASPSSSSVGSFRNDMINPDTILNQLAAQDEFERTQTMSSSVYDDESTGTPDYASIKSASTKQSRQSIERPRAGRMKTVGDIPPPPPAHEEVVVGDAHYKEESKRDADIDLPTIDFGPTYDLTKTDPSSMRPGTSGTITQEGHSRSKSKDRLSASDLSNPRTPRPGSAGDMLQDSYFGRASPHTPGHQRSNSKSPQTNQDVEENRKSLLWQPAAGRRSASPGNRLSVTPEQWVQQRAAQTGASPVFSHGRNHSTPNLLDTTSRAPSMSRNASGEWSQLLPHYQRTPPKEREGHRESIRRDSRTASMLIGDGGQPSRSHSRAASAMLDAPFQQPVRPSSRGASVMLNAQPTGLINADSGQLSAREQEHVARLTGTPLINVAKSKAQPEPEKQSGLVGAIAARQKEKDDFKKGSRSALVQQAIVARQHQAQAEVFRAERDAQRRAEREAQRAQQEQQAAMVRQQQQFQMMQAQQMQQNQMQMGLGMQGMQMPMQNYNMMGTPSANTTFQMQGGYFPQQQQQQGYMGGMPMMHQQPSQQSFTPPPYGAAWDQRQANRMSRRG